MKDTISIDRSGRLVLPKACREQLRLEAGGRLHVQIVAGHIELTPLAHDHGQSLKTKRGVRVLSLSGQRTDAAAAVADERATQADRAGRR